MLQALTTKYKIEHPLDSPQRTLCHGEIIRQKKFLRKIYEDWYSIFINEIKNLPNGNIIELGSGGGFIKELEPQVKCTDIIELPGNDLTFSALEMPFADKSIGGIFKIDTMHHISDSELFLKEAVRVLAKNGKMLMVEPANSLWGRFIYKNFHLEPFRPEGDWSLQSAGRLSGANSALPWIVFVRDNEKFRNKFPELHIESIEYKYPLSYLLSGGVSRKQFLPDFTFSAIKFIDQLLPKISQQLSMFMVIKITRW
jgi:SAM-dependent methyltransferase